MKKNILIDARALQQGFKQHKQRGIGYYARNLLSRMAPAHADSNFTYLVCADLPLDHDVLSENESYLRVPTNTTYERIHKLIEPQLNYPAYLRKQKFELVHYLAHEDGIYNTPFPFVLTVHDFIRMKFPGSNSAITKLKHRVLHEFSKKVIQRARKIITVSNNSKHDIMELCRVKEEDIVVIYVAADDIFFESYSDERVHAIVKKYRLPKEFLLYVGGIDERKNVTNILKALSILRKSNEECPPLAFAGFLENQKEYPAMLRSISDLGLSDRILYLGYIPEEEMPLLYHASTVFLFPSLYEGFGSPILQSLATGTPLLTSRLTSIPEVAGEAAYFIDPLDPGSIAHGIEVLLHDTNLRKSLIEAGYVQARKFSWEKTVSETLALYKQILAD